MDKCIYLHRFNNHSHYLNAMKTIKMLAVALVATMAVNASAQELTDNYNRVQVGYQLNFFSSNEDDMEEALPNMNGLSVGYVHGFNITSMPMFIETGIKLSAGFGSKSEKEDGYKYEIKNRLMSLTVPVSYVYKFALGDAVVLSPYAGFDFKVHLIGKSKTKEESPFYGDESETVNIFDKDDMEGYTFNRFQMGWHVGVGAEWSSFYGGIEVGTDFLRFYSHEGVKVSSGTFAVNLGYKF